MSDPIVQKMSSLSSIDYISKVSLLRELKRKPSILVERELFLLWFKLEVIITFSVFRLAVHCLQNTILVSLYYFVSLHKLYYLSRCDLFFHNFYPFFLLKGSYSQECRTYSIQLYCLARTIWKFKTEFFNLILITYNVPYTLNKRDFIEHICSTKSQDVQSFTLPNLPSPLVQNDLDL